jgi:GxxExxY protein
MDHELLTGGIIGCAMRVHRTLGPGFLESVYQNALVWELRQAQLTVECHRPLTVRYRGLDVGIFVPDVIVDGVVLIEIKAVRALVPAHEAQVVNYLTATGVDVGLLLNFGSARMQFRRKSRSYMPRCVGQEERF